MGGRQTVKPEVMIGVATWGSPDPIWYVRLASMCVYAERNGININTVYGVVSALPDWSKNKMIFEKGRLNKTDMNRGSISQFFLNSDADEVVELNS